MSNLILLVEDSEDDVLFMKRAFQAAGIENPVQVVDNGQDAVDYLAGKGKYSDRLAYPLPWIVLLDLRLPRVRGLDVLRWLRDQPAFKELTVIVVTASGEYADIMNAYRLGANSYVTKPPTAQSLLDVIQGLKLWPGAEQTFSGPS
jgi:CheY-like chemotaxis protein